MTTSFQHYTKLSTHRVLWSSTRIWISCLALSFCGISQQPPNYWSCWQLWKRTFLLCLWLIGAQGPAKQNCNLLRLHYITGTCRLGGVWSTQSDALVLEVIVELVSDAFCDELFLTDCLRKELVVLFDHVQRKYGGCFKLRRHCQTVALHVLHHVFFCLSNLLDILGRTPLFQLPNKLWESLRLHLFLF